MNDGVPDLQPKVRRMTAQQVVLHETIIRALQMVINAWQHYIKDEKKHGNSQE